MDIVVNNVKKEPEHAPVQAPEKPKKSKKPRSSKAKAVSLVLYVVVLVALVGVAGYFYRRYNDLKLNPKAAISKNNQAETNRVLEKLKLAILVTETDAPTVARVEEPDKLKSSNQEFYKDIQKGDYLIIYPKRAIIYRESNDQIINIAPIINTADLKTKEGATEGTTPASTEATKN